MNPNYLTFKFSFYPFGSPTGENGFSHICIYQNGILVMVKDVVLNHNVITTAEMILRYFTNNDKFLVVCNTHKYLSEVFGHHQLLTCMIPNEFFVPFKLNYPVPTRHYIWNTLQQDIPAIINQIY